VLEQEKLTATARNRVQSAYDRLAQETDIPDNAKAAELFLTLAQNVYASQTQGQRIPGYDPAVKKGVVWRYEKNVGLLSTKVPGKVYGDVLAMRAGKQSLELNPQMGKALSIWLAANLRRQNRLEGEDDPSYKLPHAATFYAKAAGPLRLHDVLKRALEDDDTDLALDAIRALENTAGTEALVRRQGTAQPLLEALAYPDRRVRFAAAFALGQARPDRPFEGHFRVVPVLAEAARQTKKPHGLVLGPTQAKANRLKAALRELGYAAIGGQSLGQVSDKLSRGPGIDIVLVAGNTEQVVNVFGKTKSHYKLASVPVVAMVSRGAQIELNRRFEDNDRLIPALDTEEANELKGSVAAARKRFTGQRFTEKQAREHATRALDLLRRIGISAPEVYRVADAQASLVGALGDERPVVVRKAAQVLALLDTKAAQRALAEAALESTRRDEQRIVLLNHLAASANHFGPRLREIQTKKLLELVQSAEGALGEAAARAHGALALPTSHVVEMITR
jgi:HEAT repeat protein